MTITSKSNAAVKQIRALRHRKDRQQSGLFFVEGIRLVAEAVETAAGIERCLIAPDLLRSEFAHDLVHEVWRMGVPCVEVGPDVFRSVSLKDNPQGIGVVVRQRWESLDDIHPEGELCWTALDAMQDPGNLGTILRTSDAVGGAGVILVGPTTDPYDPVAVRASMGAIFSQRMVRADVGDLEGWKRKHGYCVVGTSDAAATDYRAVRYAAPLLLFMGSEQHGLSAEEQAVCDELVSIPMVGRSDSLNVAVAAGVMLYEIFNQRRSPRASSH